RYTMLLFLTGVLLQCAHWIYTDITTTAADPGSPDGLSPHDDARQRAVQDGRRPDARIEERHLGPTIWARGLANGARTFICPTQFQTASPGSGSGSDPPRLWVGHPRWVGRTKPREGQTPVKQPQVANLRS